MLAIRFIPANLERILLYGNITAADAHEALEKIVSGERLFGKYYFIPRYVTQFGYDTNNWSSISEEKLVDEFTFDASEIEYKFTPIRRKPEKEL